MLYITFRNCISVFKIIYFPSYITKSALLNRPQTSNFRPDPRCSAGPVMSGRRSIRSDGCLLFENPTPSPHPFHTGTPHTCTLSTAVAGPAPRRDSAPPVSSTLRGSTLPILRHCEASAAGPAPTTGLRAIHPEPIWPQHRQLRAPDGPLHHRPCASGTTAVQVVGPSTLV
jgi:hypothetical protein